MSDSNNKKYGIEETISIDYTSRHETSHKTVKDIDRQKLKSPSTSSNKESDSEGDFIKPKQKSTKSLHKDNDSKYDSYIDKVEKLRMDMEKILSAWILSARNNVKPEFYEIIRKAFENFMHEIQTYQNAKKTDSSNSQRSQSSKCHKIPDKCDNNHYNKHLNQKTQSILSNALEIVDNINSRLQNLINIISNYQQETETNVKEIDSKKHKSQNKKKQLDFSVPNKETAKHLIKYINHKLQNYKRKFEKLNINENTLHSASLEITDKNLSKNSDVLQLNVYIRVLPENKTTVHNGKKIKVESLSCDEQ